MRHPVKVNCVGWAMPISFPKFVYGTTRLGDESIPFGDRVALAVEAISRTGFVHTSDRYGEALSVLHQAFEQVSPNYPSQIFKTGWESVDQIRGQIVSQCAKVGIDKMTVAQLCLGGPIAKQMEVGDPAARDLLKLKEEGLADHFLMEVFPWTSNTPFEALKSGFVEGLIDGFIFYLNPLQCFATNDLWDLIVDKNFPVVAMRTVCGGNIRELASRDSYVGKRAAELLPCFDDFGAQSWTEFCVRFAYSFPFVQTTVGSTARRNNLEEFVASTSVEIEPLPKELLNQILSLQRKWSEEADSHAEPWTM
jgi:hypothetical protein